MERRARAAAGAGGHRRRARPRRPLPGPPAWPAPLQSRLSDNRPVIRPADLGPATRPARARVADTRAAGLTERMFCLRCRNSRAAKSPRPSAPACALQHAGRGASEARHAACTTSHGARRANDWKKKPANVGVRRQNGAHTGPRSNDREGTRPRGRGESPPLSTRRDRRRWRRHTCGAGGRHRPCDRAALVFVRASPRARGRTGSRARLLAPAGPRRAAGVAAAPPAPSRLHALTMRARGEDGGPPLGDLALVGAPQEGASKGGTQGGGGVARPMRCARGAGGGAQ